jgi:hypothetical protein
MNFLYQIPLFYKSKMVGFFYFGYIKNRKICVLVKKDTYFVKKINRPCKKFSPLSIIVSHSARPLPEESGCQQSICSLCFYSPPLYPPVESKKVVQVRKKPLIQTVWQPKNAAKHLYFQNR